MSQKYFKATGLAQISSRKGTIFSKNCALS